MILKKLIHIFIDLKKIKTSLKSFAFAHEDLTNIFRFLELYSSMIIKIQNSQNDHKRRPFCKFVDYLKKPYFLLYSVLILD